MNFALVSKFLIEVFMWEKIDFALIGGFALQAVGIARTTFDIDMLVLSKNSAKIKEIMLRYGYDLIYESKDVLNFLGKKMELGRVDFLLAHRKYALAMLERAEEKEIFEGKFKIKVIKIEDLIGLKVQSSSNDPDRMHKDMADIELFVKINYAKLDFALLREYFSLFNRETELEDIIRKIDCAE